MPKHTWNCTPLSLPVPSLQRAEEKAGEDTEKGGELNQNVIGGTQGHETPFQIHTWHGVIWKVTRRCITPDGKGQGKQEMRRKQNKRIENTEIHKHPAHTGMDILRAKPKECK
jgi:hypothetical protein